MKKLSVIIIILSVLFAEQVYANGGPFNVSTFKKTGNIMLMKKANVKLLSEDLYIKIVGDYTIVKVKYKLKNNGKTQKIWYGFPVDAYSDWDGLMNPWQWNNDYTVKYFKASDNSKPLHFIHFSNDTSSNLPAENVALRRWYVVKMNFKEGEVKHLNIEYKVRNSSRDMRIGDKWLPRYSSRYFNYDLSPSGYWGDGVVDDFSVTIDLTEQIKSKMPYKVVGLDGIVQNDTVYHFKVKNYDLKKAGNLSIVYNYSHLKLAEKIKKNHIPYNMIRSIKTSSNTENAKYLIDNDPSTTWTGKKGDWIQIDFHKYSNHWTEDTNDIFEVRAILGLNGDFSSEENYNNSGKVKEVKIYFNEGILLRQDYHFEETTKKLWSKKYPEYNTQDIKGAASIFTDSDNLYPWHSPWKKDVGKFKNEDGYIWRIKIYIVDIYDKKPVYAIKTKSNNTGFAAGGLSNLLNNNYDKKPNFNSNEFSISEMYFIW